MRSIIYGEFEYVGCCVELEAVSVVRPQIGKFLVRAALRVGASEGSDYILIVNTHF